jgi:hypothetical protein
MTPLEAISSSLDDAAEIIGRQRLEISELREALKLIENAEVEEYDEELRCPVLVPMDAEEASRIARNALAKSGAGK